MATPREYGLATRAIITDHHHATGNGEVAPSISVSTTFRQLPPDVRSTAEWDPSEPYEHVYSRCVVFL